MIPAALSALLSVVSPSGAGDPYLLMAVMALAGTVSAWVRTRERRNDGWT